MLYKSEYKYIYSNANKLPQYLRKCGSDIECNTAVHIYIVTCLLLFWHRMLYPVINN